MSNCSAVAYAPRAAASAEAGTKLSANSSSPAESPEDAIVFRPFEEVWCYCGHAQGIAAMQSVLAVMCALSVYIMRPTCNRRRMRCIVSILLCKPDTPLFALDMI